MSVMTVPSISHLDGRFNNLHAAHDNFDGQCHHVQRVKLFSGLEQDELKQIESASGSLRKARGEFIYLPGDRADSPPPPISPSPIIPSSVSTSTIVRTKRPQWQPLA